MDRPPQILYLEDEPLEGLILSLHWGQQACLQRLGRLSEACNWLVHHQVEAILVDLTLPDRMGPEIVSELRRRHPEIPLVVLASLEDEAWDEECLRLGALEVYSKADPVLLNFERFWSRLQGRLKALAKERERGEHHERMLRTAAHEVRTPLNGLIGFSRLLAQTSLGQQQRDYLDSIQESAQTLLQLVNDLLDSSRNQAGRLHIKQRPFFLRDCLTSVVRNLQAISRCSGVSLELELDPSLPARVRGDELRLGQVLTNLMGNALKFTRQGSVRLLVSLADGLGAAGQASWVRFAVRDTGRGIAPEFREKIFKPFAQTQGEDERGGSGLGLMLCRQLVEAMGGEIDYQSRLGEGSEFWVILPMVALSQTRNHELGPRRVLVVDDDKICRKLAAAVLEEMGISVDEAESSAEALEMAQLQSYQLLLIDLGLPDADGLDLLTEIRRLGHNTPALALSGQTDLRLQEQAKQRGFQDFLEKPVEPEDLQAAVERWLSGASTLDQERLASLKRLSQRPGACDIVRDMIQTFLDNCQADFQQLQEAIRRGAVEDISQRAHRFRGSAATVGAQILARSLHRLEEDPLGESGRPELKQQLEETLAPLQEFLESLGPRRVRC